MEESVCSRNEQDNEIRKLRNYITQLEEENNQVKSQIAKEIPDSPPMSLSTVTKTLARKVASQLGADALSLGPENLDDSMRKVKKYVRKLEKLHANFI